MLEMPCFLVMGVWDPLSSEDDQHSLKHVVMNVDVCDVIKTVVPPIVLQLKFITKCSGLHILKKNTEEYEQLELSEQR